MGCLCCCCRKETAENDVTGPNTQNRGCTDVLFLLLYIAFVAGWVIIGIVAFRNGVPARVVRPQDYDGNTCGIDDKVINKSSIFIPNLLNLDFGICVEKCPSLGDTVCKYGRTPSGNTLSTLLTSSDCFLAIYKSNSTLWRCVPTVAQTIVNASLNVSSTTLAAVAKSLSVQNYLKSGFNELYSARFVLVIAAATAFIISLLWVFLIRYFVKLFVFLTIILVLAILILLGVIAWLRANDLEAQSTDLVVDSESRNQIRTYRGIAWIFFLVSVIYFTLFIWLLTRIRIAIELIIAGSNVLAHAKTMLFIPPLTFVATVAVAVWFIAVAIYIAGTTKVKEATFQQYAVEYQFGDTVTVNTTSFVYKTFQRENATLFMQAYNLFGLFWTLNFLLAVGYFVISSVVVTWYFSEQTGSANSKSVSAFVVVQSFARCLRYHLGTLLFGSLLISIIQFIRFVMAYVQRKIKVFEKNSFVTSCITKAIFCFIQCCLWYCEKVVSFINKNAYILVAIEGHSFCRSASKALRLLIANALRVACTTYISTFVLFLCKMLILLSNLIVGWWLLKSRIPSTPISSGVFPMFFIAGVTFAISSMFMKLYDDCVDTVMMCFFVDDENKILHFMPKHLAELVHKYEAIEKRKFECDQELAANVKVIRVSQVQPSDTQPAGGHEEKS